MNSARASTAMLPLVVKSLLAMRLQPAIETLTNNVETGCPRRCSCTASYLSILTSRHDSFFTMTLRKHLCTPTTCITLLGERKHLSGKLSALFQNSATTMPLLKLCFSTRIPVHQATCRTQIIMVEYTKLW